MQMNEVARLGVCQAYHAGIVEFDAKLSLALCGLAFIAGVIWLKYQCERPETPPLQRRLAVILTVSPFFSIYLIVVAYEVIRRACTSIPPPMISRATVLTGVA